MSFRRVTHTLKYSPITAVCVFLCVIYSVLLVVGPFSIVLSYSFHGRDYLGGITDSWSLNGWRDLLSKNVIAVVVRSLLMASANTLACISVGTPLAIAIHQGRPRRRRFWFMVLVLPLLINTLLVSYSWQVLLGNAGVVNSWLIASGLRTDPIVFLFTPGAVMLGLFGAYLPFFVAAFSTSLERLEDGFVAASQSLGASYFQTLRNVVIPMTRPGLVTGALLVFLPSFAEYVIPDLLGGGKTFLIGNLTQFAFYEGRNWPMGAALMVMTILVLALCSIPFAKFIRGVFSS